MRQNRYSSVVERTALNRVVEGSIPSAGVRDVAQWSAREAHNLEVLGSNLSIALQIFLV